MKTPEISGYYQTRLPSDIRLAQIEFARRGDGVKALNCAIGNVSLPLHPAMQKRLATIFSDPGSPFIDGSVQYTPTVGRTDTREAFLKVIASSGFDTQGLLAHITDGGSAAMELVLLGVCGAAGAGERPLLLIDAAYVNYQCLAERIGRKTICIRRTFDKKSGRFSLPDLQAMENVIEKEHPAAILVIPYDNPTGHFYSQDDMDTLGQIAVRHNIWLVSDEAYRELYYTPGQASSIWGISEEKVPGIRGRRISIETASKVWNGCGLRVGAIITDSPLFHEKAVYEYTANLCANHIGQWAFAALLDESFAAMQAWYKKQRAYYYEMMQEFRQNVLKEIPGILASSPDASIYSVLDLSDIVPKDFSANKFVMYASTKGRVSLPDGDYTLLLSPMSGFYTVKPGEENPGRAQMRVAYVETPENMRKVPKVLAGLLKDYLAN